MPPIKRFLIAVLTLAVAACAGTTAKIESAQLAEVQKGKTTVAEVVRQFGRPSVLSKNPDGSQTALYVFNEGGGTGTTIVPLVASLPRDSATFYFDTNGVLSDFKTTTRATADKPAAAEAKAPATETPKATTPDAAKAAPIDTAKSPQPSSVKPAPVPADKPATLTIGKPPAAKPAESQDTKWSLPSWLPSSTEQRR
jgi:hypothetical protein